jgi:hypothetical protein
MTDYSLVLEKYYPEVGYSFEDNSYNTIHFVFGDVPSKEHLDSLWSVMEIDVIREKRNKLLQESDFRVVSDYPQRDKWLIYRQQLRDFPEVWVQDMEFPEIPT